VFGVRAEVVKELLLGDSQDHGYFLMPYLLHTFNLVMATGTLPKSWCQGCVHPRLQTLPAVMIIDASPSVHC
jgi:hypothetical protein